MLRQSLTFRKVGFESGDELGEKAATLFSLITDITLTEEGYEYGSTICVATICCSAS